MKYLSKYAFNRPPVAKTFVKAQTHTAFYSIFRYYFAIEFDSSAAGLFRKFPPPPLPLSPVPSHNAPQLFPFCSSHDRGQDAWLHKVHFPFQLARGKL